MVTGTSIDKVDILHWEKENTDHGKSQMGPSPRKKLQLKQGYDIVQLPEKLLLLWKGQKLRKRNKSSALHHNIVSLNREYTDFRPPISGSRARNTRPHGCLWRTYPSLQNHEERNGISLIRKISVVIDIVHLFYLMGWVPKSLPLQLRAAMALSACA